ncbi:MAG: hypothetical protein J1F35_02355 [Erysipelotrichales bacterium]|nr:hypothetical protein [Erysipelotrichales bacterium]
MKKFFEKHDLFKIVGIVVLVAILLTWLVGYSYYSQGTLATEEFNRVGLFDLSTYGLLQIFYFTVVFMFVFVVGGFYKFVASLPAYDSLTTKIASKLKGKEKVFVALSTLVFASLSGISVDYLVLFAIIPFVISILSKLNVDKITGLVATFGGVLIGIIGATYSPKITGILVDAKNGLGVSYGYELLATVILFAVTYLVLTYFTFARMNKNNGKKGVALLVDPFATVLVEEKKTKKSKKDSNVSTVGLVIVLAVTFVSIILAFIGWDTAFNIKVFANAFDWISNAELFGQNVYSFVLGSSLAPYGSWDLLSAAGMLLFASLVIKLVYHVPFDKMLDEYGEGLKVIGKPIVILMMIYLVLEISVIFPTIAFFVDKIMSLGTNIGTLFVSGVLTSIFTVDFQYVVSTVGSLFTSYSNINVAALILQAAYGVVSFIAPTSVILMLGLSNLDIKYSDYFKFIWKFVIAAIIIAFVVLAILIYV